MVSQLGSEQKRSKYRLLGLVGQGQFGRVYCAAQRQTGRLVALKDLDRQRFPTHKFLRELRFLLRLQHPNIVTFQAIEHTATGRYLVMDYCEGGTLRSLMPDDGGLNLPQSLKLVADILMGLDHAHQRDIVHCDIKPENILLSVTATSWTARISDFGIARLSQEMSDEDMGNTGSPAYMAPERFYGQYSPTSDLYSVGILLYELLAGHRPFSGTPAELMSAHLNRPVKFPETIPELWRPLISTALQKLSARRFRSAKEMLAALLAVAATEGSASWLDPQTVHLPLLRSAMMPCSTGFKAQQQEALRYPLSQLAVATQAQATYCYRAERQEVTFQVYPSAALHDHPFPSEIWHTAALKSPIRELLPRPQGCFVLTDQSLHLLPTGMESDPNLTLQRVSVLEPESLVAIEAKGRWMASLIPTDKKDESLLTFQRLLSCNTQITIASQPLNLSLKWRSPQPPALYALDAHHVAVLIDRLDQLPNGLNEPTLSRNKKSGTGTLIKILCRRGKRIGSLILPLHLGKTILTPIPYRLLAVDRENPYCILLIDLKPYRVLRLGVEIVPTLLAVTSWGYLLASEQGELVLLDQIGQKVGCITGLGRITAIAPLNQHQVAVATWDGTTGSLYTIDLREAGVDLLF